MWNKSRDPQVYDMDGRLPLDLALQNTSKGAGTATNRDCCSTLFTCVISGFMSVQILNWFRVLGSSFRVQGSGFRVQGSGFRVEAVATRPCPPALEDKAWLEKGDGEG